MKRTILYVSVCLVAACSHSPGEQRSALPQEKDSVAGGEATAVQEAPANDRPDPFPDVAKQYYMRPYSDALQQELDARNARRPEHTEEMTLLDAGIGQDVSYIHFRDAAGRERTFAGWSEDIPLKLVETEDGEDLAGSEKGRRYNVTWSLKAYWSDPGGEVVEHPIVSAMVPL